MIDLPEVAMAGIVMGWEAIHAQHKVRKGASA
jgi:hypothetical protein